LPEAIAFNGDSFAQPLCFCGSRRYRLLLNGSYDRLLGHDYAFEIVQCLVCGLARTLPVPDPEQYEQGFVLTTEGGRFVGATEDAWSARIVDDVRAVVPSGRLLDVGCHVGNLVEAANAAGFDAEGIDLDPVATAEARRLGRAVLTGRLEDLEGTYDAVVMSALLEHILDLRSFVGHVERLLAPNGHAFVYVPYHRGLMPRLMGQNWMGWAPNQHVWHFSPRSLIRVVHEASPLRLVRYTTKGVIEPPSTGVKGRVKKAVDKLSRATGWGDQIEAIFRKPDGFADGR
jgi:SAM-dependent methyltransferase